MSFNIAGLLNPAPPGRNVSTAHRHFSSSSSALHEAPGLSRTDSKEPQRSAISNEAAADALTALLMPRPTSSSGHPLHDPLQPPLPQQQPHHNSTSIATHDTFNPPYSPHCPEVHPPPSSVISPIATPLEPNPALDNLPLQRSPTLDQYHHGSRSPEEQNRRVSTLRISQSPKLAPIQNLSNALNGQLHRSEPDPAQAPTHDTDTNRSPNLRDRDRAEIHPSTKLSESEAGEMADTADHQNSAPQTGPSIDVEQSSKPEPDTMENPSDHQHLSANTPNIKTEPSVTPRETSPHQTTEEGPRSSASMAQVDGVMDDMDEETYKTIQAIKNNDLGLRRTAGQRETSAQSPPKETPEPATKKRPTTTAKSIAATKKGTAKKPPPKKRKLSFDGEDEDTRRASATKVAKTTPNPPKAKPPTKPKNDPGSDGDEDGEVYCICRRGDDHSFMLACDNCDEWFHAQCVRLTKSDCDQIDAYICPNCEKDHGLQSTWKPLCRNPVCQRVARVGDDYDARESKYCSDDCAVQFFRDKASLDSDKANHAKRRKANRTDHDANSDPHDTSTERRRGDALRLQDLRSIVDHVGTSSDKFHALGDRDLAMLTPPDSGGVSLPDDELPLLPEERAALRRIEEAKETTRARRAYLNDRSELIQLARENAGRWAEREGLKVKDVCGFDGRLVWDEGRLRRWWEGGGRPGLPGEGASEAVGADGVDDAKKPTDADAEKGKGGELAADTATNDASDPDAKMTGTSSPPPSDLPTDATSPTSPADDDHAAYICTKKRCARHAQWPKLQVQDVRMELSGAADQMRELEAEEREVRERAVVRARVRGHEGARATVGGDA
ncbi:hypothetical protein P152DRAFT_492965 [Eremomyces bilateralis CBS 781.70]|uniref:PHD-type domain-containing protein n=1 Tax=Eremomyces bilateralis CBS 781.70 TaxID=1392243 RepID=A0A6G1GES6_9PEZI|nr:uncharacterized protein P152DRAFT_492965 [Eremomyces bilateralis CBS 781.70]KAF1816577.1 hypothetical protein P152DRAFT_492965 [Eremomyces bilateralis CBS 781.70]